LFSDELIVPDVMRDKLEILLQTVSEAQRLKLVLNMTSIHQECSQLVDGTSVGYLKQVLTAGFIFPKNH